MATANSTPSQNKPPKAGGVATQTHALPAAKGKPRAIGAHIRPRPVLPRKYMLASEQRTVNKAMDILGSYLSGSTTVFTTPKSLRQYVCLHLGLLPYEVFGVLFLDAQHRLIAFEKMFRGTLTEASVYPREVVVQALHHRAASVVLTHNHPSGQAHPSRADEAITQTLKAALCLVDVRVLDHFIVAGNQATSMAGLGLL
jgi:DNA repair protein RadC